MIRVSSRQTGWLLSPLVYLGVRMKKMRISDIDFSSRIARRYAVRGKLYSGFPSLVFQGNKAKWFAIHKEQVRETWGMIQRLSSVHLQLLLSLQSKSNRRELTFFSSYFTSLLSGIPHTLVKLSKMAQMSDLPSPIGRSFLGIQQPQSIGKFPVASNFYRVLETMIFHLYTPVQERTKLHAFFSQDVRHAHHQSGTFPMAGTMTRWLELTTGQAGFSLKKRPASQQPDKLAYAQTHTNPPVLELAYSQADMALAAIQTEKKVETDAIGSASTAWTPQSVDIHRLTEQVYQALERKLRIEKERRGLS